MNKEKPVKSGLYDDRQIVTERIEEIKKRLVGVVLLCKPMLLRHGNVELDIVHKDKDGNVDEEYHAVIVKRVRDK